MNWAHVHIAINHTPIIGAVFGLVFLAYATWRKSAELEKTGLGILVVVAATALVTFLTGDPAADSLRGVLPDIQGQFIDRHCELAEVAMSVSVATGVCGLVALAVWRRAKARPSRLVWASLLLSVLTLLLMAWTGYRGGEIRHTEIRPGATVVPGN